MTREQLLRLGESLPDAVLDAPFEDKELLVLRRKSNRRWFAVFLRVHGRESVNLKCDPMRADLYRRLYPEVTPGWHMNKTHWNTVALDGRLPDDELRAMLVHSYELVGPAAK